MLSVKIMSVKNVKRDLNLILVDVDVNPGFSIIRRVLRIVLKVFIRICSQKAVDNALKTVYLVTFPWVKR